MRYAVARRRYVPYLLVVWAPAMLTARPTVRLAAAVPSVASTLVSRNRNTGYLSLLWGTYGRDLFPHPRSICLARVLFDAEPVDEM